MRPRTTPVEYLRERISIPVSTYLMNRKTRGRSSSDARQEIYTLVENGDARLVPTEGKSKRAHAVIEITDKGFYGSQSDQETMKQQPYIAGDGYKLKKGLLVRVSPRRGDRCNFNTAKVVEAGQWKSLILPANHHKNEYVDNDLITIHKSRCSQMGITFEKPEAASVSPAVAESLLSEIRIGNTYREGDNIIGSGRIQTLETKPETQPVQKEPDMQVETQLPQSDDFDVLANYAERLAGSAYKKLMALHTEQKAAKQMLQEIETKITLHISRCKTLGIDMTGKVAA